MACIMKGMRRRRLAACVVGMIGASAAALVASCGAFTGESDSNVPSADAQAVGEANAEGAVTASDGASADAPEGNAPGGDAGSDALLTSDGRYCANLNPAPVYCRDYDEPDAAPSNPFTHTPSGGAASVTIDSLHHVSPSNEITFFTSAGATDNGDGRTAAEFVGEPAIAHTARLAFNVFLDAAPDTQTTLLLAALGFGGSGTPAYNVAVTLGGGQAPYISEQYSGVEMHTAPLVKGPAINAWSRIDMTLDFDKKTGVATVDGVDTMFTMHSPTTGNVSISIGVAYYNGGQNVIATTTHFDNVAYYGN
jgi:hypothetical protein